jgi:hypothetical protein
MNPPPATNQPQPFESIVKHTVLLEPLPNDSKSKTKKHQRATSLAQLIKQQVIEKLIQNSEVINNEKPPDQSLIVQSIKDTRNM